MRSRGFASGAHRTALCGILVALSTVCLYLAAFTPVNQIAVTAVAGLFPIVAVEASGRTAGFLCWISSSLLGLLISPEKWLVLLYLLFLGLYPVVKSALEGIRVRPVEWLCKFVFFNVVLALFWFGFRSVFLPALPVFLQQTTAIVFLVFNVIFLLYDIGLSRLIVFFLRRFSSVSGNQR